VTADPDIAYHIIAESQQLGAGLTMQPLIELALLAAAADGNIDDAERFTILKSIAQHVGIPPISELQISSVKKQLLDQLRNGYDQEGIIRNASQSLDQNSQILSYAIAVEIILSNSELTANEVGYLKLLRDILELDNDKVVSIHFSAKLRYGFGELE